MPLIKKVKVRHVGWSITKEADVGLFYKNGPNTCTWGLRLDRQACDSLPLGYTFVQTPNAQDPDDRENFEILLTPLISGWDWRKIIKARDEARARSEKRYEKLRLNMRQ